MAIKEYHLESLEDWKKFRSNYIGGSDASSVCGLSPYRSRYTLWAEKTGKLPAFEGNTITRVGDYLEDFVAKLFEEETGKKVRRKNRTMVNDLYPFACANLDRLVVGEKAFLEIKTTTSFPIMRQCRSADFPEIYYSQVIHYMAVTGLEKAYLAVLINCRELKIFELERDEAEIKALMDMERDFWELVKNNKAPDIDGSDSTSETITQLYPTSTDRVLDLSMFEGELLNRERWVAVEKDAKNHIAEIDNKIKDTMRDANKATAGKFSISYSTVERKTFDTKKYQEDHKGVNFDGYYKTSSSRQFRITAKKEK